jgi:serine O-acetyltransferase
VVGRGSIIAGNAWLTQSVPAKSVVTRRSEVRARHGEEGLDVLDYQI